MADKRWLQVAIGCCFDDEQLLPDGFRCGLEVAPFHHAFIHARIDHHADRCRAGDELSQQLQPLSRAFARHEADAGDVAAGPVEARHQPVSHRIASGHEHDRHCRGRRLDGRRGGAIANNHRHRLADHLGGERRQAVALLVPPAVFDGDVAAHVVAAFS